MKYDPELILENIRSNIHRNIPQAQRCKPHQHIMSIAGGAPSLADTKEKLEGYICSINGSHDYLLSHGIIPNACGVVDPHEHIADQITPHPDVTYFVASQAHPKVFEKLKDNHVVMWHALGPDGAENVVRAHMPDDWYMIGGGETMGLRWLNLGFECGFRKFHIHGMDSSYKNGRTHAYEERQRDIIIVSDGYRTSPNFLRQVSQYHDTVSLLSMMDDIEVTLYGDGLLQRSAKQNYWERNKELRDITPPGSRWPEGDEAKRIIKYLVGESTVLDYGCGDGRFTDCFSPAKYTGYDINKHAIEHCKSKYPNHDFCTNVVSRETALAYTVLLHISDEEIEHVVQTLSKSAKVIIAEIMDRKYRRAGNPPVFNRDPHEYIELFQNAGMRMKTKLSIPYDRYGGEELTIMEFVK